MGLFSKKVKVDLDQVLKDKYKEINKIVTDANKEIDFEIRISLLTLAKDKYEDLFKLIDEGANFDKDHFKSLQSNLIKEIEKLKGLEDGN